MSRKVLWVRSQQLNWNHLNIWIKHELYKRPFVHLYTYRLIKVAIDEGQHNYPIQEQCTIIQATICIYISGPIRRPQLKIIINQLHICSASVHMLREGERERGPEGYGL